jgi:hypothetical protein
MRLSWNDWKRWLVEFCEDKSRAAKRKEPLNRYTVPGIKTAPSPTPTNVVNLLSEWEQQDKNEKLQQMASTYKKQLLKQRG